MQKILVLRGGALGDFVVTLPALHLLRRRWPRVRLEFVGNASAAALGRAGGLIDAVHSQHEARWAGLFGTAPLPDALARTLAEFDLVVSYWPDPDGELAARFPLRSGQVFLTATALPTQAPAAAHYCEPLRALGLATGNYHYRLKLAGKAPRHSTPRIALHPGSGSPRKNWAPDRWAEVCRALNLRAGAELLIVTGEAEPAGLLAEFGESAHQLPLPDLARRLAGCSLFLGHDSGVSHLAAAVGVPCVLLFGPTDPAVWAPPGPQVRVIRRGADLSAISVEDVLASIGR